MFSISKANYGWITKAPTQAMLHPLQRAVNRHSRHARANPMLAQILETDLECETKIHIRTFMVLARRLKKNPRACQWEHTNKRSQFAAVRQWMEKTGWEEETAEPFSWTYPDTEMRICLLEKRDHDADMGLEH